MLGTRFGGGNAPVVEDDLGVVIEVAFKHLFAAFMHQPEFIGHCPQQMAVVGDEKHCAFVG